MNQLNQGTQPQAASAGSSRKHTLFITGAAGYVGTMLAQQFSDRDDVAKIVCLDKVAIPDLLKDNSKIIYMTANTADKEWIEEARAFRPTIVIHTAWQIREMYGDQKTQWKWNVDGSDNVFDFAFSTPSVERLIHFSTVASYAAYPDNEISHAFKESEPFRVSDYLYAEEKRVVEKHLEDKYAAARAKGATPKVAIVRPAAITGPRGRYMRIRFGLQAALSGQLKESFLHRLISLMVSFTPITEKWCRQFIHEDDVVGIIRLLAFSPLKDNYDVFNICPPGPVVTGKDMGDAVNKKTVKVSPQLIRVAFFIMWHLSRGKVPTSKGGWKSYSYPIVVDGAKISHKYGFQYTFEPKEAFTKREGFYMKYVR